MAVITSSGFSSVNLSGKIGLIGPIGCINLVIVIRPHKYGRSSFSAPPVVFSLRS